MLKRKGAVNGKLLQSCIASERAARMLLTTPGAEDSFDASQHSVVREKKSDAAPVLSQVIRSQVRYLSDFQRQVSPEMLQERLDICSSCPHKTKAPDEKLYHLGKRIFRPDGDDICGLCGCFLSEKAKRKSETCPDEIEGTDLGRWSAISG